MVAYRWKGVPMIFKSPRFKMNAVTSRNEGYTVSVKILENGVGEWAFKDQKYLTNGKGEIIE